MTFAADLADDRDNAFLNTGEFAESATYTAPDGTATAVTVVFRDGSSDEPDDGAVLVMNGVTPAKFGTVLVSGASVTWVVDSFQRHDTALFLIECQGKLDIRPIGRG